jgi:tetratricopeptide (TPR) repeat protein
VNDELATAVKRVQTARVDGDVAALTDALARYANELVKSGQLAAACTQLDEAAELHRRGGRTGDEASCLVLAASLCRLLGDWAGVTQRSRQVLALMDGAGRLAVAAHTELGEAALATGEANAAQAAFSAALQQATAVGLDTKALAAILRKRAAAHVLQQQYQAGVHDLETASRYYAAEGEPNAATRTLVEQATILQQSGQSAAAHDVIRRATHDANNINDHAALADLCLLRATLAIESRDTQAAMDNMLAARTHALAGNAPAPYIGASIGIADLADAAGNRAQAYESLAVGWATLADLVGADLARAAFAPKLREKRETWGHDEFAAIKASYEAERSRLLRSKML